MIRNVEVRGWSYWEAAPVTPDETLDDWFVFNATDWAPLSNSIFCYQNALLDREGRCFLIGKWVRQVGDPGEDKADPEWIGVDPCYLASRLVLMGCSIPARLGPVIHIEPSDRLTLGHVTLEGEHVGPIIFNRRQERVSTKEYELLEKLVRAGYGGIGLPELRAEISSASNILTKLMGNRDYKDAILRTGRGRLGNVRIAPK